jgi:hypothetical protein
MCHYILNIQIFLTNIRNGGIRMQRYFFSASLRHIVMFVKMNMKKESHKSISCRVYFSLYFIRDNYVSKSVALLVFISFYIYNNFFLITSVKSLYS